HKQRSDPEPQAPSPEQNTRAPNRRRALHFNSKGAHMFTHEIRNGIAWVTFDSGGMNTLSRAAVEGLGAVVKELERAHAKTPLVGVILTGNRFGLGAGANIGELMNADREQLGAFLDQGHELLYAIEEGPLPWLAVIDGFALGGIY